MRFEISRIDWAIALVVVVIFSGADWLRFRGPNGSGVAPGQTVPSAWSHTENIAWRVPLPGRGLSGPIVIGDRVIVTACSGYRQDRLHVTCFDVTSGARLWERQFWASASTTTHPKTCTAASTPASDGERIFAYFSSNDLVCLDLDGNLLWLRGLMLQYPNASNSLGLASSPVVAGEMLVVTIETDSQSLALGLETSTGQAVWEIERPKLANWTSPVLLQSHDGTNVVVLQSGRGLTAYDIQSGRQVWHDERGCATIPSSVAAGDRIFTPSHGLVALEHIPGQSAPRLLWANHRLDPTTATPLVHRGQIYVISGSVLRCADAATGALMWQLRLEGNFTSSPVAAGSYVYLFNEEGKCQVVKAGEESGQIVAENDLGETILATPAIARNALYVRSDSHLWRIADTGASDTGTSR